MVRERLASGAKGTSKGWSTYFHAESMGLNMVPPSPLSIKGATHTHIQPRVAPEYHWMCLNPLPKAVWSPDFPTCHHICLLRFNVLLRFHFQDEHNHYCKDYVLIPTDRKWMERVERVGIALILRSWRKEVLRMKPACRYTLHRNSFGRREQLSLLSRHLGLRSQEDCMPFDNFYSLFLYMFSAVLSTVLSCAQSTFMKLNAESYWRKERRMVFRTCHSSASFLQNMRIFLPSRLEIIISSLSQEGFSSNSAHLLEDRWWIHGAFCNKRPRNSSSELVQRWGRQQFPMLCWDRAAISAACWEKVPSSWNLL